MESVLAAFFVMFLMVFGVLTLTEEFVSTQTLIEQSWQEMESRRADQATTQLVALTAHTSDAGNVILLMLQNKGMVKLADFTNWNVIVQYTDDAVPSGYHIDYMPYSPNDFMVEGWSIRGIYLDAELKQAEGFEVGIINPGEVVTLQLRVMPSIGPDQAALISVALTNGVSTSYTFARSALPILETNTGIFLASAGIATISDDALAATDPDNPPTELVYKIIVPPVQGTLSLSTFTQVDINQNQLIYTHTGDGNDGFQFTLTDGENLIGPYIVTITINEPPVVTINAGLTLDADSTAPIDASILAATDPDTFSAGLTYTVTSPPTQGMLSQTTFTQADIESGLVTYTDVVGGSDTFQFTITDGVTTLGPLTFTITMN